jgi:hypothetical protein
MILRLYSAYKTGKKIYSKVLKPIYEELRRDAYANDNITPTKKSKTKNADDKKPKHSYRRKENPK